MGANITIHGQTALIRGVPRLQAAYITGTDIRAAAALLIAALAARGESILSGLDHLDRGYDGMIEKLVACGADISAA
jgi:UDP-N-acetylglucosamine 1-carboxyvinyltransferase